MDEWEQLEVRGAVQPSHSSMPLGGLSRPVVVWTIMQIWGRMKGTESKQECRLHWGWGYIWDTGFH